MLSNKIVAAHLLRLYVWEMLDANNAISTITTKDRETGEDIVWIPIIPVEDEPELRDSEKAYIIYGWSENDERGDEEVSRGNVAFRIIAEDTNQLSHITSVLSKGMDNEDETANSVNHWSTNYNDADLVGIRFTWIKTVLIESADPASEEGGEVEGNVMVGYRYVSSQEVITYKPGAKLNGSDAAWR